MERKLYITPPALMRWQPKDKLANVVFLDIDPDFLDEDTIRVDLNIVFRPIPVKRGWLQTRDYYVGSTGARITFEATGGKVKRHTQATSFTVDYENTYKRSQQSSVKVCPKVETGTDTHIELGEISLNKDEERTYTARFSGSERTLSDINLGNAVEWEIAIPPGQVIRDYLIGNLYLYVESSWNQDKREGRIELRPSDISFFDSNRRLTTGVKAALAMRYKLHQKGIRVNRQNVVIYFRETR